MSYGRLDEIQRELAAAESDVARLKAEREALLEKLGLRSVVPVAAATHLRAHTGISAAVKAELKRGWVSRREIADRLGMDAVRVNSIVQANRYRWGVEIRTGETGTRECRIP